MIFTKEEYRQRVSQTRLRMEQAGIDTLITCDPANMNYLTGYDGWSFYVPQMVIVAQSHDMPLWVGRGQDEPGARLTSWLDEDHIHAYGDDYVQAADRHPMDFAIKILAGRGWDKGTVSIDMDGFYVTPRAYEALKAEVGKVRDSDRLVNWVRSVKSDAEIGLVRQASRIIEIAMQTAMEVIAPGVRQCDAVAKIVAAQYSGTPEFGGDYTAIVPLLPTGANILAPHLTWSDEKFATGEATMVELAGCRHRYHSPMARTIYLGTPSTKVSDMCKVFVEGVDAAIAAARAGVACEEVEAAWRGVISKVGIDQKWRIGYSVGVNYPPDWGEGTMSLRPGDRTVLQPNMVFHLIPSIVVEGIRIEISECVRVTESGGEALANFPRRLFVKP